MLAMTSRSQTIVHAMLASYLPAEPETLEDSLLLEDELGLDPLDLVLVAVRLAELVPRSEGLPFGRLQSLRTVGDLVDLFESAWDRDTLVEGTAPAHALPA